MWELWLRTSWHDIGFWLICIAVFAVVVEAVAEIITSSYLFAFLRNPINKRAFPQDPADARWYWALLNKLVTCGYCCSVWLAFVASWAMPGDWFEIYPLDNLLIKIFLIHRVSNVFHTSFELLRRGRIRTYDIKISNKFEGDDDASS